MILTRTFFVSVSFCVLSLSVSLPHYLILKGKIHHQTSCICDIQFVMKCSNFHFMPCLLCFSLPHQLLLQSVISQNAFKQLPGNGVSLQQQRCFPSLQVGQGSLIVKLLATSAKLNLDYYVVWLASLFSIIHQLFTTMNEKILDVICSHPLVQSSH